MFEKINNWLPEKLGSLLASMPFLYFCVLLVVLSFIFPWSAPVCVFISSTVIQLWSLPILGILNDISTNKIISLLTDIWNWQKETHNWQKESHDVVIQELAEIKETHKLVLDTVSELKSLHQELHQIISNCVRCQNEK